MARVVTLTGFMGTGKTAVGERLAQQLGRRFVDTDAMIEAREGRSVAEIFATDGESYFRRCERDAVARAATLHDTVIATGGGAILDEGNLRTLLAAGPVICLTASPDVIFERTAGESRPLLAGADNRRERIRALLTERAPAYARATATIDTSHATVEEVVELARRLVRQHEAATE